MVRLLALISLGGRLLELASHGSELYASSSALLKPVPIDVSHRSDPPSRPRPRSSTTLVTVMVKVFIEGCVVIVGCTDGDGVIQVIRFVVEGLVGGEVYRCIDQKENLVQDVRLGKLLSSPHLCAR